MTTGMRNDCMSCSSHTIARQAMMVNAKRGVLATDTTVGAGSSDLSAADNRWEVGSVAFTSAIQSEPWCKINAEVRRRTSTCTALAMAEAEAG